MSGLIAACDAPSSVPTDLGPPPSESAVIIAKDSVAIPQGQSFQLAPVSAATVTGAWASLDPDVVTVTTVGVAHAEHAGSGRVTYESSEAHDTVTIVVPDPLVRAATVTVTMAATTLSVGMTGQAVATVKDEHGVTLVGRTVAWRSSNEAVAQVSSTTGVVTAVASGTATIVARTNDDRSGSIVVVVSGGVATVSTVEVVRPAGDLVVGQSVQLVARAHTASAAAIDCHSLTWTTSDEHTATVSPTGLATGIAAGSVTITATCDGKTGTLSIAVVPPPAVAAAITVTLTNTVLAVSGTTQAHAVVRDATGQEITRRVVWASSDTTVARVTDGGLVTATGAGSATVTASVVGVSGTATATVSSGDAHAITVALSSSTLPAGGTMRAAATVYDALQQTMPNARVTWHSSNPSVATVSDGGLVTALQAGTTVISASIGTIVGEATLVITAP